MYLFLLFYINWSIIKFAKCLSNKLSWRSNAQVFFFRLPKIKIKVFNYYNRPTTNVHCSAFIEDRVGG